MKPSDFRKHPLDSILQNTESEIVARNIMVILARTGDEFRLMEWDEYLREREADGLYLGMEQRYFEMVRGYCVSEKTARQFCSDW